MIVQVCKSKITSSCVKSVPKTGSREYQNGHKAVISGDISLPLHLQCLEKEILAFTWDGNCILFGKSDFTKAVITLQDVNFLRIDFTFTLNMFWISIYSNSQRLAINWLRESQVSICPAFETVLGRVHTPCCRREGGLFAYFLLFPYTVRVTLALVCSSLELTPARLFLCPQWPYLHNPMAPPQLKNFPEDGTKSRVVRGSIT